MKVGVLTSSRADYSIYLPLLKMLKADSYFLLEIIAFGTHLSTSHGYTVKNIENDGFEIKHRIHTLPQSDTAQAISSSIGSTISTFSSLWETEKFDLVFCLGDRYEMFAACASSVPFNVKLAHIHGGEQTLGAIDDVFRHSITLMSSLHFTAAEPYKKRVEELTGKKDHIYNTGSLSIDNLSQLSLLSREDFQEQFHIDLNIPSILITFHPETVSFDKNEYYIHELLKALKQINGYQFIFTMPNTDTMGSMIRKRIQDFIAETDHALGVESFGTIGYLSCMKHCSFMLGNTSSGFIEASYFPTRVINLGDRQKGRILTEHIINCDIQSDSIVKAVHAVEKKKEIEQITLYGSGHAAKNIIQTLKLNQ